MRKNRSLNRIPRFLAFGVLAVSLLGAHTSPAFMPATSNPAPPLTDAMAPLPSSREFKKMIESASEASQLDKWKNGPFHLVAKVHYSLGASTVDGMYEILWAAKDQLKVNLKLGDSAEVYVLSAGKAYHWRTSLAVFLPKMTLDAIVQAPLSIWNTEGFAVRSVHPSSSAGQNLICAEVGDSLISGDVCADATTREIVSASLAPKPHKQSGLVLGSYFHLESPNNSYLHAEGSSLTLAGGVPNAPSWFPARIERKVFDERVIVEITRFDAVKSFAESVFTPPRNATVYDWCAEPVYHERNPGDRVGGPAPDWEQRVDNTHFTYAAEGSVPSVRISEPGELLAYYLIIGPDGRSSSAQPLRANDPHSQAQLEKDFAEFMFPVMSCHGTKISREMIFYPPIELVPHK